MIGYKVVVDRKTLVINNAKGHSVKECVVRVVELEIPDDAETVIQPSGKCRADRAKVLSPDVDAVSFWAERQRDYTRSNRQKGKRCYWAGEPRSPVLYYRTGETVYAEHWDPGHDECTHGIHFFPTIKETLNWVRQWVPSYKVIV